LSISSWSSRSSLSWLTLFLAAGAGNGEERRADFCPVINLNMINAAYLALLAIGIALLVVGFNATHSFSSDVSKFFTGAPTDKAIWMLIGGAAAAITGLVGTLRTWIKP
jgi:hypothetical protein